MAYQAFPVKEVLACIDQNAKSVWKELTDEQKKCVNFWLLNRYASSVAGPREAQELAVVMTNQIYNKNWNELGTRHPQLQWQLLCVAGKTGKKMFHPWIGLKKKKDESSKAAKLLSQIYPEMKLDEVELLARISTTKELKELAEQHGMDKKDVKV